VYLAQSSQPRFIFFEIQRENGEDVLYVKQSKREGKGAISRVTNQSGGSLVGVWKRELRVESSPVNKIQIKDIANRKLVMQVLEHDHMSLKYWEKDNAV
jgi:hypothetical protein